MAAALAVVLEIQTQKMYAVTAAQQERLLRLACQEEEAVAVACPYVLLALGLVAVAVVVVQVAMS